MKIKKINLGIFLLLILSGCAQNTALLGPVFTLTTSGNVYQAGLSYGSEKAINKYTGMTTGENIKQILTSQEKDTEFEKMVKKRIKETRKKLNLSNQ